MTDLPAAPGSYLLVLHRSHPTRISVGRLGALAIAPGFYIYCGSAFGPGGLRARLGRHLRGSGKRHWHIDYLRAVTTPRMACFSTAAGNREHDWATELASRNGLRPVPGFGCTDCSCSSHLLHADDLEAIADFRAHSDVKLDCITL